jgi:hypothetical protein
MAGDAYSATFWAARLLEIRASPAKIKNRMNIGIVESWDARVNEGQIASGGVHFSFAYTDGRTIIGSSDQTEPMLGRHLQPGVHQLKEPRVGDVVVFVGADSAVEWAFAEHYMTTALRKVPSEFRSDT